MPKRNDISTILIIGAGPIVIGQACEFDYSGTQACKALKEEGYRVILINSNPATIMTDPEIADSTYVEPINTITVEKIIKKEKPCAILPTMGGQTALNIAIELEDKGILKKENVELIGATKSTIEKAEDRKKFRNCMKKLGIKCPKSVIIEKFDDAELALNEIKRVLISNFFSNCLVIRVSSDKIKSQSRKIRLARSDKSLGSPIGVATI